jgi:hypothetical protein
MQGRLSLSGAGVLILACLLIGFEQPKQTATNQTSDKGYSFERGYPAADTAQRAYDDNDLNRAIEAYKFF